MNIIYAKSLSELQVKAVGLHHDHCYHKYFGKTKDVPEHLKQYIDKKSKFIFIYEE